MIVADIMNSRRQHCVHNLISLFHPYFPPVLIRNHYSLLYTTVFFAFCSLSMNTLNEYNNKIAIFILKAVVYIFCGAKNINSSWVIHFITLCLISTLCVHTHCYAPWYNLTTQIVCMQRSDGKKKRKHTLDLWTNAHLFFYYKANEIKIKKIILIRLWSVFLHRVCYTLLYHI